MKTPALFHRTHQIILALAVRHAPPIDPALFPNQAVWRLFTELHPHDQRHLLAVHDKAAGARLPGPICLAGLLHDIGKVTLPGTRISLVARIAHVVLERLSPAADAKLAEREVPLLGVGMRLAHNHARIGANRLRALGVDEEVCRIVEFHDNPTQTDPDVRALQNIDSSTP